MPPPVRFIIILIYRNDARGYNRLSSTHADDVMYICVCKAVTDREIRQCAELGACSLRDLERCLGVGTNCGRCREAARSVLEQAVAPGNDLRRQPA